MKPLISLIYIVKMWMHKGISYNFHFTSNNGTTFLLLHCSLLKEAWVIRIVKRLVKLHGQYYRSLRCANRIAVAPKSRQASSMMPATTNRFFSRMVKKISIVWFEVILYCTLVSDMYKVHVQKSLVIRD